MDRQEVRARRARRETTGLTQQRAGKHLFVCAVLPKAWLDVRRTSLRQNPNEAHAQKRSSGGTLSCKIFLFHDRQLDRTWNLWIKILSKLCSVCLTAHRCLLRRGRFGNRWLGTCRAREGTCEREYEALRVCCLRSGQQGTVLCLRTACSCETVVPPRDRSPRSMCSCCTTHHRCIFSSWMSSGLLIARIVEATPVFSPAPTTCEGPA